MFIAAVVAWLWRISFELVAIAIFCALLSAAFLCLAKSGAKGDADTWRAMLLAIMFALLAFILLVFAALNYPPVDRHSRSALSQARIDRP
jgi:hypothetical protein